ncbi:MAG: phosphopantothenate/pantothenate synthetase [Methanobacteriaceae archaeon]|jgi:4-phosphopantoate--beta-alanine ligase|nr:MAG: phosphopantothenate/pantothenate synthetase [Methanobacterium sp. BRmetb2]MCC7558596.1 phosphopantothenate/pantothenate synthetase [Methanobacteriaceae archaeon]
MISKEHPRYKSLLLREKIVKAYKEGVLADSGMIAHGRGEAFDYLLGEKTSKTAKNAIKTAAATLLLAENPVISVNGNTAALVPEDVVELVNTLNSGLEINLFYRTPSRVKAVETVLKEAGAQKIMGVNDQKLKYIDGLKSPRATASPDGIYTADVVLVPLEDGDRTEVLINSGKKVITIDLNPLSRTSQKATITIVDNIVRAIPLLIKEVKNLENKKTDELERIVGDFDNKQNLRESLKLMSMM